MPKVCPAYKDTMAYRCNPLADSGINDQLIIIIIIIIYSFNVKLTSATLTTQPQDIHNKSKSEKI